MADRYPTEIICDFRSAYHLDWHHSLWRDDPDTVEALIDGLRHRPDSLMRAALMRDLPPVTTDTCGNPSLDWYGLTQEVRILSLIYNLLGAVHGQANNKPRIDPPTHHTDPITDFWSRLHPTH